MAPDPPDETRAVSQVVARTRAETAFPPRSQDDSVATLAPRAWACPRLTVACMPVSENKYHYQKDPDYDTHEQARHPTGVR